MRCLIRACALAAAGLGAILPAGAASLKVDYAIALAGLPLGTAEVSGTFEGERYELQVQAKLTGFAGLLTGGSGGATASGTVTSGQPLASSFAVVARSSGDQRTVKVGLARGNVVASEIVPPLEEKGDRVPVTEAHKRGVVDPVSALLMPVVGRAGLTDPAVCNRTIPIFDGAARYNIVLSYGGTRNVEKVGYRGPVLVCDARYVPIAGHRSERPGTKFMQENRDMSVWLAPVQGTRLLVPLRISVKTMIGTSVVEAQRWSLDPGGRGSRT